MTDETDGMDQEMATPSVACLETDKKQ